MSDQLLMLLGQCLRKRAYHSNALATKVAWKCGERTRAALYVYSCPHCFKWHISKKGSA